MSSKIEMLRKEGWNKALYCLATSYIFQKKAESYEKYLRYNSILGLIIPIIVGAVAVNYGANSENLAYILIVAAPVSVAQIVLSALVLGNKWDSKLAYSFESQTENRILSDSFIKLCKFPPSDEHQFELQYEVLSAKDNERTRQDEKITFSDKEKRMGMRYGLMMLSKTCATCKETPISMTPSKCLTCGKF